METTSCGRVLDAISAIIGVCYERTYEGEPAMKLESAAIGGRNILNLEPNFKGGCLDTTLLAYEVFTLKGKRPVRDLAYSAEEYIARGLAQMAVEEADRLGVRDIGFSGGVAYNEHIVKVIRKVVKEHGFNFSVHRLVPPGDGGLSFGQAVAAAYLADEGIF